MCWSTMLVRLEPTECCFQECILFLHVPSVCRGYTIHNLSCNHASLSASHFREYYGALLSAEVPFSWVTNFHSTSSLVCCSIHGIPARLEGNGLQILSQCCKVHDAPADLCNSALALELGSPVLQEAIVHGCIVCRSRVGRKTDMARGCAGMQSKSGSTPREGVSEVSLRWLVCLTSLKEIAPQE